MRRRSAASGTAWLTLAQIAPLVVNIALTPFVIAHLGETRYGLWLVSSSVALLLGQIDGGVYRSGLRLFGIARAHHGKVPGGMVASLFFFMMCLVFFTMVPLVLFPAPVAAFFHAPETVRTETEFLIRTVAVVVIVGLLRGVFVAVLHSHMRFALTALATIGGYLSYALVMFISLGAGAGLEGVALAYVAQAVVTTAVMLPAAAVLIEWRGQRLMGRREFREFGALTWRVQVAGLLNALTQQGSLIIVGRLRPSEVASFGPGATFAQNFRMVPSNALAPVQSRLSSAVGQQGVHGSIEVGLRLQRLWAVGLTGLVAAAVPASYFGVNAWLPISGDTPGRVASVLICAHYISLLPQVMLQWFMSIGQPEVEMRATLVSLLVLVTVALPAVSAVGAIGVGLAMVLGNAGALWYVLASGRRLALPVSNPLWHVPWVSALATSAIVFICELALRQAVAGSAALREGPLALLLAAAAALPGLAVYAGWNWGWSGLRDAVARRITR